MNYSFTNDYSEGCHPSILEALSATNLVQQSGYGDDVYTTSAAQRLRALMGVENADIHLIAGGTLTNLVVLASILQPYESVIAPSTGHISTHETGAIEATGHKVEEVLTKDGKLRAEDIRPLLNKGPLYHTIKPRVVYISNSTELGTIYTKAELEALSVFCRQNDLLLYMDGARLASALMASVNDLTMHDIAHLVDVFYFGGTKCGALLGEAVIIVNEGLKANFKYHLKQRGAMLAKGRVLGVQFDRLLEDQLVFTLAKHANIMAGRLAAGIERLGYSFLYPSFTNQIFPVLPNEVIRFLQNRYDFIVWDEFGNDKSVVRLVTSWATQERAVDSFVEYLSFANT